MISRNERRPLLHASDRARRPLRREVAFACRGDARRARSHPRAQPEIERVLPGRRGGRARRRARVRGALAEGRAGGAGRRRAGVDKGSHPRARLADVARLEDGRSGRPVARRCARDRAPARKRRGAPWQDMHAGIRLERRDRQRAHRHHPQPVEPPPDARGLEWRRVRAARGRARPTRGRDRRRGLDPHSVRVRGRIRDQGAVRPRAGVAAFADGHGGARRADGALDR